MTCIVSKICRCFHPFCQWKLSILHTIQQSTGTNFTRNVNITALVHQCICKCSIRGLAQLNNNYRQKTAGIKVTFFGFSHLRGEPLHRLGSDLAKHSRPKVHYTLQIWPQSAHIWGFPVGNPKMLIFATFSPHRSNFLNWYSWNPQGLCVAIVSTFV